MYSRVGKIFRIVTSLADDGCNTEIESFQTDRFFRVFHSCYFHYSEYRLLCLVDLPLLECGISL